MNKGINLLGKKKQLVVTPSARRLRILRLIAVSVLFGVSGLSIILFVLIAFSPLPTLQQQEKAALLNFSQAHPDVAKLLLIEDRLKSSATIINKRPRFDAMLATVQEKMPNGIAVTELTIEQKKVSVTVTSVSLGLFDTFLNNLTNATKNKEDFSQVEVTDFFINNQTNTYTMTVNLVTI